MTPHKHHVHRHETIHVEKSMDLSPQSTPHERDDPLQIKEPKTPITHYVTRGDESVLTENMVGHCLSRCHK